MNVLHIVSWYPSSQEPFNAQWIHNHIRALPPEVKSKVVHLDIRQDSYMFGWSTELLGNSRFRLAIPLKIWRITEIIASIGLLVVFSRFNPRRYDVLNFHIAYPNLVYWHFFSRYIKTKVLVTEHWSAYHFNFGLPPYVRLGRAKRIFDNDLKLVSVSKALALDIERFAGHQIPHSVVPNTVDTEIFRYDDSSEVWPRTFFILGQWKHPKDPFTILRAFSLYGIDHEDARLIIGGYGPQMTEIEELIVKLKLMNNVQVKGPMDRPEIAATMNQSAAFIHISEYETFSVVCAEAICCGCPVIASRTGGIPEFINNGNGFLVNSNTVETIVDGMRRMTSEREFDRRSIANSASLRFNQKQVGLMYLDALNATFKK